MHTSGFHGSAYLATLPWIVLGVLILLALTYACARRAGRNNVIDTAWGLGFCVVAAVSFAGSAFAGSAAHGSTGHGDGLRRYLLLGMVLAWGLRLAWHVGRRSVGKGEDPRYRDLLAKHPAHPTLYALAVIYGLQGLLVLFVSLPVQLAMFETGSMSVVGWLGVALWSLGMIFESVGDRQMSAFRADPANRGKLIDVGLWRYTRHPNYFGDACVWVALYLVAAQRWSGVLTFLSPVVMVYLLANGSGKKVLERAMITRPGYREYMRRTSGFVPLPPRA